MSGTSGIVTTLALSATSTSSMAGDDDDSRATNLAASCAGVVPNLADYGISPQVGFMTEKPLRTLSEYFHPWWKIATRLPELIQNGTLRDEVNQMPCLDYRRLDGEPEWGLAHVVLCAITQSYVWMLGEKHIPHSIPESLAVPFCKVSELLGITPSFCQFNGVLSNWKLIDPDGPVAVENMIPIISLIGGEDQAWFFMLSGQMEIDFAPAICGLVQAQQAMKDLDVDTYISALERVEKAVRKMKESLARMNERCRPNVFYNVLRPYLAGWDSPAFKEKGWKGLIYEGVSSEPLCYGGGSAAQSSTLPCLDAALGINHQPAENRACHGFQRQMLPRHRGFIKALADGPSIRNFAATCKNSKALHAYNACLQAVSDFRSFHLTVVARYIIIQSHRNDRDQKYERQAALGSGGTGFMQFLKAMRRSVKSALYQHDEGTEIN